MNCNDFKHDLALLAGEDLEEAEAKTAARHSAECPSCRDSLRHLEDSQTIMRTVRETPLDVDVPSLWPRIRAQLMPATLEQTGQHYPNWVPSATLAAACLALLVFVGSTPMFDSQQPSSSTQHAPLGQSTLFDYRTPPQITVPWANRDASSADLMPETLPADAWQSDQFSRELNPVFQRNPNSDENRPIRY